MAPGATVASERHRADGGVRRLATVRRMSAVTVEVATEATAELREALNRLLPQLSSSAQPLTDGDVAALVGAQAVSVFVARSAGTIVGSLTLAVFPIPTGVRAWIEDVVVDSEARGLGVGEGLNRAAIEHARSLGAKTVDLTSRPSREAANRLYRRLGFVARETNVYRFDL